MAEATLREGDSQGHGSGPEEEWGETGGGEFAYGRTTGQTARGKPGTGSEGNPQGGSSGGRDRGGTGKLEGGLRR